MTAKVRWNCRSKRPADYEIPADGTVLTLEIADGEYLEVQTVQTGDIKTTSVKNLTRSTVVATTFSWYPPKDPVAQLQNIDVVPQGKIGVTINSCLTIKVAGLGTLGLSWTPTEEEKNINSRRGTIIKL